MNACPSCPNKWLARLFESLGDAEAAQEIRDAGCSWWWTMEFRQDQTGQIKTESLCGREALPRWLNDSNKEIKLAADTIQRDRTEQANALENIREAAQALGFNDLFSMLAQIGLEAAVSKEVEAKRQKELEAAEDRV